MFLELFIGQNLVLYFLCCFFLIQNLCWLKVGHSVLFYLSSNSLSFVLLSGLLSPLYSLILLLHFKFLIPDFKFQELFLVLLMFCLKSCLAFFPQLQYRLLFPWGYWYVWRRVFLSLPCCIPPSFFYCLFWLLFLMFSSTVLCPLGVYS